MQDVRCVVRDWCQLGQLSPPLTHLLCGVFRGQSRIESSPAKMSNKERKTWSWAFDEALRSNLNWIRWSYLALISFPLCSVTRSRHALKIGSLKKSDRSEQQMLLSLLLHLALDGTSSLFASQRTVLPGLLSSAMHVTPGLVPMRRCWWDGSLTGPAAAPQMPLIYNAQLWHRRWGKEFMRNVTLSLPPWHTLLRSDCILMIRHRHVPIRCCCAVSNGGSCRDAWWNEIYSNNNMEMRLRFDKTVSETDRNQFSACLEESQ